MVDGIKEHMQWLVLRGIIAEEYAEVGSKRFIYYHLPYPKGPNERPRGKDPVAEAVRQMGRLYTPPRGVPVLTSNATERRRKLQQPGVQLRVKNAERARKRQEQAVAERAAQQRARQLAKNAEGGTKKKTKRSAKVHSTR